LFTPSDAVLLSDQEERIKMVNSGEKHSFILTNRGRLFGIGVNDFGQVGVGNVTSFLSTIQTTERNINKVRRIGMKMDDCGIFSDTNGKDFENYSH